MKGTKRIVLWLMMTLMLVLAAGHLTYGASISQTSASIRMGGKLTLRVSGASGKVKWKSSKKSVASVNGKGVVTGKKAGTSVITATAGSQRLTCTVRVTAVKLNASKVTMEPGNVFQLKLNGAAAGDRVTWKSSKKSVATVTASGKVTGVTGGSATITARLNGKNYKCKINVKKVIKMSINAITLNPGGRYTLEVLGVKGKRSWSSSNPSVASVNASGLVTAGKAGSATITAKVKKKTYACTVTVKSPTIVTKKVTTSTKTVTTKSGTTAKVSNPIAAATAAAQKAAASSSSSSKPSSSSSSSSSSGSGSSSSSPWVKPNMDIERAVYNVLISFKSKYPEGMRFTNADYRDWVGGIYRGGYGCAGFVFELSDAAYRKAYNVPAGTLPPMAKMRTTNMTDLRPGDIIRLDYNTHSVIVLRVAKSYVEVAEANYNKSVHWGRIITFAEILQTGTNIITRYDDSYQVSVGTQALEAYQTFMKARASLPALSDPRS